MADKSVNELAQQVGRPVEKLLAQLVEAGLPARAATEIVTDSEQEKLVAHLRQSHSQADQDKQITLQRKTLGTAKVSSSTGKAKTINVEVRKKHTFTKPTLTETQLADTELATLRRNTFIGQRIQIKNNFILLKLDITLLNDSKDNDISKSYRLDINNNIIELNLQGMQLEDLPEFKAYGIDLSHIEKLDLSNNNIKEININEDMQALQTLNLSNNAITKLSITGSMPELNILDLDKNEILDLSLQEIGLKSQECILNLNFDTLQDLNLGGNCFTELKFNKDMPSLKRIDISYNKETIVEFELSSYMPVLEYILLQNSRIEIVLIKSNHEDKSDIEILPNLKKLYLQNNNIRSINLPYTIFNSEKLSEREVDLNNNPLPDLFLAALKKNTKEEYFKTLKDLFRDVIDINRVKLMFLGNTGVGKTTLSKILENMETSKEHDGISTHGVNIFRYMIPELEDKPAIDVRGYDFGGQDYYHSTHYSFFGSNALFVLLWGAGQFIYHRSTCIRNSIENISQEEISYPLDYWLGSVSYFSRRENSHSDARKPEVEVMADSVKPSQEAHNKKGLKLHLLQNPQKRSNNEIDQIFDLDTVSLRQKYNFIGKIDNVPPLIITDIEEYRASVKEKLDHWVRNHVTTTSYPSILYRAETYLMREKKIIVSKARIEELFKKVKNKDWEGDVNQLMEWLHITMSIYWVSPESLKVRCDLTPEESKLLVQYERAILRLPPEKDEVQNSSEPLPMPTYNSFPSSLSTYSINLYNNTTKFIDPTTPRVSELNLEEESKLKEKNEVLKAQNEIHVKKLKVLLREDLSAQDRKLLNENAVLDLATLTSWIHNILSIKGSIRSKNSMIKDGYFTRESILNSYNLDLVLAKHDNEIVKIKSVEDQIKNIDYTLAFMLYNKVIFRVPKNLHDDAELYIAPTYLDEDLSPTEQLFLDTFDPAIVEYRFEEFYHVNIFTEVLVKFSHHLPYTPRESKKDSTHMGKSDTFYFLWKNKAILFEQLNSTQEHDNSIEKNQSQSKCNTTRPLLYLDFDLGGILNKKDQSNKKIDDQEVLKKPCIRLRTLSRKGQPVDEFFLRQIMSFIEEQLAEYRYRKMVLAPNQLELFDLDPSKLDYIDVNCIKGLKFSDGNLSGFFPFGDKIYRVADFNLFADNRVSMKKIFISHSTNDYQELSDFITHISPLKRLGLIDHWHCSQLIAGQKWDATIQKNLLESDIICMLISPSWLENDYIIENELKVARKRKQDFETKHVGRNIEIMPIIIKSCGWDFDDLLKDIQAAPQKAIVLSSYTDKNTAWTDVAKKLSDLIKRMDDQSHSAYIGSTQRKHNTELYSGNLSKSKRQ